MANVEVFEGKIDLPALVERVLEGERITITKHGLAVAMLVPAEGARQADRKQVIEELKAFGRGRELPKSGSIRELINEGRRF